MLCGANPITFTGDFNTIRTEWDREGCKSKRLDSQKFNQSINCLNLLKVEMENSKYTGMVQNVEKFNHGRMTMWGRNFYPSNQN